MDIKLIAICVVSVFCVGSVKGDGEYCFNSVTASCSPTGGDIIDCNSKYGAFAKTDEVLLDIQRYANKQILRSFQYLLMSSHFGNFEKNRAGFEKLYRKLSDQSWEDSIDLVKFLGKRGGHMDFKLRDEAEFDKTVVFENHELGSMATALDIQKDLANGVHSIHEGVTRKRTHDPEVASYFENNFVHKHSDMVRTLSGHTNDLKHLIANEADPSLSLYLFDEYLQKTV